jgi:hypothetical protein
MADEKHQIELELNDAKPTEEAEVVVQEVSGKEEETPVNETEAAISELRRRLEAESKARYEAEVRAHQAAQQVSRAYNEVEDTQLHLVNSAIDTVKRDNDVMKANYRDAMATGDYDRAAEIQEAMSINSAKLLQLENGRQRMQEAGRTEYKAPPPPRPVYADPIEQIKNAVSPRSAGWLERNRGYLGDDRKIQRMFRAHEDAVDEGLEPDSDAYFKFVENRLGIREQSETESESPLSSAASSTSRRSAPPAAPVSRSGTGTGSRSNVVRLTAEEREMAEMMGMTDQEYAKNKVMLQKEGKLKH